MYEATSIILATGVNFGKPFKGEEEFLGKGVGYCATCDAPLYKDKVVTIIAYNKHEEAEANFIGTIASKVYYVPMYKQEIEVDRTMKTNIEGCYAAGDIVGTPYQYIKAAGEGNIAALSAVSYIEQIKRKNKEV